LWAGENRSNNVGSGGSGNYTPHVINPPVNGGPNVNLDPSTGTYEAQNLIARLSLIVGVYNKLISYLITNNNGAAEPKLAINY
jgi:hypothetical protein